MASLTATNSVLKISNLPPRQRQRAGCVVSRRTTRSNPEAASAASPSSRTEPAPGELAPGELAPGEPTLCCPVCFRPFAGGAGNLSCSTCRRRFDTVSGTPIIADLTINRSLTGPQSVELFKNPLISTIYQRGWRQGFAWAGFPGVDEEATTALDVFRRTRPSVLLDLSCGSGLFCKKFVDSGEFKRVIAVDYSRSMLEETRNNGNAARTAATAVTLIQADAARLPFETGSIEAIHAGAAIHCWPDPVNAAAEISRVLCPDKGVFVGTTFLGTVAPFGELLGDDALLKPLRQFEPAPNAFRWWYEDELRTVFEDCGLAFEVIERRNRYVSKRAHPPPRMPLACPSHAPRMPRLVSLTPRRSLTHAQVHHVGLHSTGNVALSNTS